MVNILTSESMSISIPWIVEYFFLTCTTLMCTTLNGRVSSENLSLIVRKVQNLSRLLIALYNFFLNKDQKKSIHDSKKNASTCLNG